MAPGRRKPTIPAKPSPPLYSTDQVLAYKTASGVSLLLVTTDVDAVTTQVQGQSLEPTAKKNRYRPTENITVEVTQVIKPLEAKKVGKVVEVEEMEEEDEGESDRSEEEEKEEEEENKRKKTPSKAKKSKTASVTKDRKPEDQEEAPPAQASRHSPRKVKARPVYKDYTSSSGDDSGSESASEAGSHSSSPPRKPRRRPKSKSTSKPRPSKRQKLLDVPEVAENEEISSTAVTLYTRCCVACSDRNVLRAGVTHSLPLFKSVIQSKDTISSLEKMRGPDISATGLYYAVVSGDKTLLKAFLAEIEKPTLEKAHAPYHALEYIGTGYVSKQAFGVHVRKVNQSRGGREGNNALLNRDYDSNGLDLSSILPKVIKRGIEPSHVDVLLTLGKEVDDALSQCVGIAVKTGNLPLALHLIQIYNKKGGFGFNELHSAVLGKKKLPDFKKVSITKKVIGNFNVAPLHCACINPNPGHLKTLLEQSGDMDYADTEGWKAVHYAAVCVSSEPMKVLLGKGANVEEMTKWKLTPIMIAASRNRAETVKLLLDSNAEIDKKSRQGKAAIHYAAKANALDALKVLIAHGTKKTLNLPGPDRKTALLVASTVGNIEAVRLLIESGASIKKKDKLKRTALLLAVKNGHADVAAELLRHHCDPNEADSSKNSPLHYACAYGWWQCVELLLACHADINAVNDWKLPALLVALLKGHSGLVNRLLEVPGVDVNCKDEEGRTLLSRCISVLSTVTLHQMEVLLERHNADPNLADLQGFTPLHHLAALAVPECEDEMTLAEMEKWREEQYQFREKALEMLLTHGADWKAVTENHHSVLHLSLQTCNYPISRLLIAKSAFILQPTKKNDTLLHAAAGFNLDLYPVVMELLEITEIRTQINAVNDDGFTPFLMFCVKFLENHEETRRQIRKKIKLLMIETAQKAPKTKEINEFQATLSKKSTPKKRKRSSDSEESDDDTGSETGDSPSYSVNKEELNAKTEAEFTAAAEKFANLLSKLVDFGANSTDCVSKLMKYRLDPMRIQREYEESKTREKANSDDYYGSEEENSEENELPSKFFVTDYDGSTHWNEYNEHGLKAGLHLLLETGVKAVILKGMELPLVANQRDFSGNTALHKVAKMMMEAQEYIDRLVAKGVDLNVKNCEGQTPLHIACSYENDEVVTSLLRAGAKGEILDTKGSFPLQISVSKKDSDSVRALLENGVDPNFCDGKLRTALHHAFNSADVTADASFEIEAMLLEAGADINKIDVRKRTPLHYAFVKIGNPDIDEEIDPVETVSSACSMKGVQTNLQDLWGRTALHYAAQRGSVTSAMILIEAGADVTLRDEAGNTALAIALAHSHSAFATMLLQHKIDINLPVVVTPKIKDLLAKKKEKQDSDEESDNESESESSRNDEDSLPIGTYSTFRAAIKLNWLGVAYLLLYRGYDYMRAMQDALSEQKFQLCLTLLAKVTDSAVLRESNEAQENLFHTLAKYGRNANTEITSKLGARLHLRKVDYLQRDLKGQQALHLAAGSHYPALVTFLLNLGVDINAKDSKRKTALVHAIEGNKVEESLETLKALSQADFNVSFNNEDGLSVTPIIHAVMHSVDKEIILFMLSRQADISAKDGLGRNLLMHAIKQNNVQLVEAVLGLEGLDLDCVDKRGWTYAHHVVCPLDLGSFENEEILKMISKAKVDLTKADNDGLTPYSYACKQRSGVLKAALKKLKAAVGPEFNPPSEVEFHPPSTVDYHSDFQTYIQQKAETMEVDDPIKPDPAGKFSASYVVVDDYDVLMARVDLSYGPHSAYLFYRMQLLRDKNRDVYVVFTRWGRIGETGAYQRTPFSDRSEAESEFKKIFREKTKNEWGSPFTHIKGKYRLLPLSRKHIEHKQFLQYFDFIKAPPPQVPEAVQKILKQLTDSNIYSKVFQEAEINLNVLNFANLGKSDLVQAQNLICEIGRLIEEMTTDISTEKLLEIKETLYDLSSRFYELIPVTTYVHSAVDPIYTSRDLKEKMALLESLMNVEIASKIVLGAMHRQDSMNPYDYCYLALRTEIVPIETTDPEYRLLHMYAKNGGNTRKIAHMFRISREDELPRIQQHAEVKNRMLLWHGSAVTNFLGILTQGLKIAPPEAPATGYMFGKGLYFADYFSKSYSYCETGNKTNSFMLLAEVVLGKWVEKYEGEYVTKLPESCMSVKAIGRQGPDMSQSIVLNNGIRVPCGVLKEQKHPKDEYISLHYNEYIVYDISQVRLRYILELID